MTNIHDEASFWDKANKDLIRKSSFLSIVYFPHKAVEEVTKVPGLGIIEYLKKYLPKNRLLRGLVLGCGDMAGEHIFFCQPDLPFAGIDAYDVSANSIAKAKATTDAKGIPVQYHVADVNSLELTANNYDLVVISHAYHHFEKIEHVSFQVNKSLSKQGIFWLNDYIGPRRLQRTPKQLHWANMIWGLLDKKFKKDIHGNIIGTKQSPNPQIFSPNEAIASDLILPALNKHFKIISQYNWAGLLYPLIEGFAFNFSPKNDQQIIQSLFALDKYLCKSGLVEPDFTITVAGKKE